MQEKAILKAAARLSIARTALHELPGRNFQEFDRSWFILLVALNQVYNALNAGAKGKNRSIDFVNRMKGIRRRDPLLRYFHHARNDETHGIEPIAEEVAVNLRFNSEDGLHIKSAEVWPNRVRLVLSSATSRQESQANSTTLDTSFKGVALLPVRDGGTIFHPPTHHLSKPLTDEDTPTKMANLACSYHESLIHEAKKFI
jgi:hypothetical protein